MFVFVYVSFSRFTPLEVIFVDSFNLVLNVSVYFSLLYVFLFLSFLYDFYNFLAHCDFVLFTIFIIYCYYCYFIIYFLYFLYTNLYVIDTG